MAAGAKPCPACGSLVTCVGDGDILTGSCFIDGITVTMAGPHLDTSRAVAPGEVAVVPADELAAVDAILSAPPTAPTDALNPPASGALTPPKAEGNAQAT